MSKSSPRRQPDVPPEITFVTLPQALAQFHHLPIHAPVWVNQQAEFEKKGYNFGEGARAMETLLEKAPGVPGAYLYQLFVRKWPKWMETNVYFESGRIAEAIPKLVEILDIDPECPLTCFQLGYCFRATGEMEKSESFYKNALRMAPDAGWIYSNLARTYLLMGEKAKAAEAFWKALELLPGDHYVLEQLVEMGELFLVNQSAQDGGVSSTFVRRADYEKRLREAVEKEKEAGALIKLGWKALQDRLTLTACEAFEKARRQNPEMNETLLGLGTAHLEAGRYKEAERFLVQYLDDNPQSAVAHLNLFKSYLAQDENELAWEEIQTAVRLDPDRLDALRQLCFLLRETGRREEGLEWMDRLAKGNPSSFAPLLVKAQSLAEEKKWPEAQAALEEALKRSPHNEEVLLIYTAELGNRGKQDELIRLLKSEPGNLPLSLTINLALAYSQTGQLETGKETLRQFIQRPDTGKLDQARAKAILREFER